MHSEISQQASQFNVLRDTVKHLYLSIKGMGAYPQDHPATLRPLQKTYQMINDLLSRKDFVTTSVVNNTLVVEDVLINGKGELSSKFVKDLTRRNVMSFTFSRGLSSGDLRTFLAVMAESPDQLKREGGVANILKNRGISNIRVNEVKYEQVSSAGMGEEHGELFDFLMGACASPKGDQERFFDMVENHPEALAEYIRCTAEVSGHLHDPETAAEYYRQVVGRIARQIMAREDASLNQFSQTMGSLLSSLDTGILYHMARRRDDAGCEDGELIDTLTSDLFYEAFADTYVHSSGESGMSRKDLVERMLPTKKERSKALRYVKKALNESGRQEAFPCIVADFSEDPGDSNMDDISIKEVQGSEAPNDIWDYAATKQKAGELLSSGRVDEAWKLVDDFSRRMDDKSSEIRKQVAESFKGIISSLDEFDKLKENFHGLSNMLIDKLKREDHIDTYLSLAENLKTVCDTQKQDNTYYIDETLGYRFFYDSRISKPQLQQVLTTRKTNGRSLQYNLAALNYATENDLIHYLTDHYRGFSLINTAEIRYIPGNVISSIPLKYAKRYLSLPIKRDDQKLYTALANPNNMETINDLEFITGYSITPFAAAEYYLANAIDKFYNTAQSSEIVLDQVIEEIRQEDGGLEFIEEKEELPDYATEYEGTQGPIVKMVNLILKEAVGKGASDIHIEPYEDEVRVRFRVDGSLIQAMKPPFKYRNGITSRIKVMSRLNISEKRLPQDGRFRIKVEGKCIDFRVSIFPGGFGEKVVLRLLDKSNLQIDMAKLGMKGEEMKTLMEAMYKSKGMILVTGPTGSGKSTTLYSVLQKLNDGTRNINTAEDPVEYNIHGINQFQMNPAIGLDFARALRSFLRQDPDVIMVGEMRDLETAQIAVKAALTGHLVLSTLHTNSAAETITRLLEMGIEPFLVATSVDLIIAQRLMRKICPACRYEAKPPDMYLDYIKGMGYKISGDTFYVGKGCPKCYQTGYRGRFAIYELLPMRHEIREMIIRRESPLAIQSKAEELGLKTLRENAFAKAKQGITSIEEWMKVVG